METLRFRRPDDVDVANGVCNSAAVTMPPAKSDHAASFPLFDWLRFSLASLVVLDHGGVIPWANYGNLAVQIFFALSGWLIGGILLRTERAGLPRFFFNRGTRIWLPYLVAAVAIYGLGVVKDGFHAEYLRFLFHDVTFTHNFFIPAVPEVTSKMPLAGTGTHFWSISVEEQFYLAAPLLIVLVKGGRSLLLWSAIALIEYFTHDWYASISLGVLAAIAQSRFGDWHLRVRPWLLIAAVIGAIGMIDFSTFGRTIMPALIGPYYPWFAPLFAISVVLLTAVQGRRRPLAMFLGGMSYPLYLNQWIGIFAAHMLPIASPLLMAWATYPLAVAASAVAYVAVDKQVQRYRGRLYTPARGRIFTAMAYSLMIAGIVGGLIMGVPGTDAKASHQPNTLATKPAH